MYSVISVCILVISASMIQSDSLEDSNEDGVLRKNYTARDLIFALTKLAQETNVPRLRFPNNAYAPNYSDDPRLQDQNSYQNNGNQFYNQNQNPNQQYDDNNQYPSPANQNYGLYQASGFENGQLDPQLLGQNRPLRKRRPKKRPYQYRPQYPGYPNKQTPYPSGYVPQDGYPQIYPTGAYPQDPYIQSGYPQGDLQDPGLFQGPNGYPPGLEGEGAFSSLTKALSSIAKFDERQCVPRLLCEVAAGGNPSSKQSSYIPSFLNMESLFTLLSAFTGKQVNPLLVFGRAALLGVSSQGRPSSCYYAYPSCPRDPDRLVEYLNNHNGGFFRFFNGIQPEDQDPNAVSPQGSPFGLSQLNQLFGQITQPQRYPPNLYNRRPEYDQYYNNAQAGNYGMYPNYYGNYGNYGRKGNTNVTFEGDSNEARIQNNVHISSLTYQDGAQNLRLPSNDLYIAQSYHQFDYGGVQNNRLQSDWTFPESNGNQLNSNVFANGIQNDPIIKTNLRFPDSQSSGSIDYNRSPKLLTFPSGGGGTRQYEDLHFPRPLPYYDHSKMIFPDRTGTGNLKFDSQQLSRPTSIYRPEVYRPEVYRNELPTYNYVRGQYSNDQYQSPSKKKKYIYIVRGNGDPNHPEVLEDTYGRQLNSDDDKEFILDKQDEGKGDESWRFPSTYQGVIYNDRSFDVMSTS